MNFWVKTNYFVKKIFPNYIWTIPSNYKKVYLTFDDGPIPENTEWILEQLKKNNAKATFFCIGNNIEKYPEIFNKIIQEEHAIGNHTFNHIEGWKTSTEEYINNVKLCESVISHLQNGTCNLFRPPYGKIKNFQAKKLKDLGYKIIMWDVLSRDYDQKTSKEQCLKNVLKNIESGSIIVFHDSIKAQQNMKYVLPKTLEYLKENGFYCDIIR